MQFYEASALEDRNIKDIFHSAAFQIMERIKNNKIAINKDVEKDNSREHKASRPILFSEKENSCRNTINKN